MKHLPLSLMLSFIFSSAALALSSDPQQPVYIDSDSQQLDMKSNQVTFLGDVKLKQGSITINADRLVVIRNAETGKTDIIESYGNLTTFSQLTDEGNTLYGEAQELHYRMVDDELIMIGKAKLSQDDSEIRSTKIRYQISSQKLLADSEGNGRVSTVLQPQAAQ